MFVVDFDDFCLVVKSQPLLLECFTLDTLDARQRDTAVPSDQAAGVDQHQHHGKLCTMEAGKKGKERWKDRWYVLSEGVLSFYTSEDAARKGNRHGRIDLRCAPLTCCALSVDYATHSDPDHVVEAATCRFCSDLKVGAKVERKNCFT
jgi:hypothetical protein